MPRPTLYAGPRYPELEAAAFERLASTVGDAPRSLLYVVRSGHAERPTRERWREHGRPLSLSLETFDGIVGDCHERTRFAGPSTYVDQPLRDRLVELAVERLEEPSNPLSAPGRMPSAGRCRQVEDLLSLVEFAGLGSAEAVRERLAAEGLDAQAGFVSAVVAAFDAVRDELGVSEREGRTLRAERYRHVLAGGTALSESLPSVEAVVLGGFRLFSPLERRLVDRLAGTWPTVALVPQVVDSTEPAGVDRGAERALRAYRDLGFEREYVDVGSTPGLGAAGRLYRPSGVETGTDAGTGTDGRDAGPAVSIRRPETVPAELRWVARDVRRRIGEGTPPERIGVVLADPGSYRERLVETFDEYGIPATLAVERAFGDTALGEVVAEIAALGREDPPLESVTALFSNPLVTDPGGGRPVDRGELARVAGRLTSRRLEAVHAHLDGDASAAIRDLVADVRALREVPLAGFPGRFDALLERLGVPGALEALPRAPRGRVERTAADALERALETLAPTGPVADTDRGDPIDRLERALTGETVEVEAGREEGHVLVCGLSEAVPREFDHAYVLGLTEGGFPSNPERLASLTPINESHEDFERADVRQGARYDLGLLLAGGASLVLSVPERDLEGDPYVEAGVVTELRRVTGIDPEPASPDGAPPGSRTDVQRSLARAFAHDGVDDYAALVDVAADAGAFDGVRRRRLQRGVACAAARASPALTPHDGQLSPETVAMLHGPEVREPYSPSRLETYAKCGFRYHASRVLGIEEPDELGSEPDARERGGFVHDVLEDHYAGLQTAAGEPVGIRGDREEHEEHLLGVALSTLEERFDGAPTAFQREWLVAVLAGLGEPGENPHYGGETYGGPERGLFVRVLDHEFGEVSKATARPAWLEPRIGEPYGDETVLREAPVGIDTPTGTVPLAGKIDRVDAVPGTDPTQLVVRDYKTGGTPSEADTLSGLALQLPLYALLAEGALEGVETVGGAYYQVRPPTGVNHRAGLVGSDEHAAWAGRDGVETPLTRWSRPAFGTHDAFRQFVERTVPKRLGRLADGIESGRYHPTLLDPGDAGCRFCGYRDVCDVRPYRRREVIDALDDGGAPAHVPLAARDVGPVEALDRDVGVE